MCIKYARVWGGVQIQVHVGGSSELIVFIVSEIGLVREIQARKEAWIQWRPGTRKTYIRIVSVEGLIGAGKSYLLNGIAQYIHEHKISGVGIFREPVGEWSAEQLGLEGRSLLQEIAVKPGGSSFAFQVLALVGYYVGVSKVIENMCEVVDFKRLDRFATVFVERSPESNMLFATYGSDQGWWTPADCVVYHELCSMLRHATDIPRPCVRVVVEVDKALASSRIATRGRPGEEHISGSVIQSRMEEFLKAMCVYNEDECARTVVLRSDQNCDQHWRKIQRRSTSLTTPPTDWKIC
jgi:deoxyadenosine/deoxycytidine kinase